MIRKDYIRIAEALASAYRITRSSATRRQVSDAAWQERELGLDTAVIKLADALAAENPSFNRERFIEAATPPDASAFDNA